MFGITTIFINVLCIHSILSSEVTNPSPVKKNDTPKLKKMMALVSKDSRKEIPSIVFPQSWIINDPLISDMVHIMMMYVPEDQVENIEKTSNFECIEDAESPIYPYVFQYNSEWNKNRFFKISSPTTQYNPKLFFYRYNYLNTEDKITVYVVDSGIDLNNEEFEGRATFGYSAYDDDALDRNGHGTRVAEIIGGKTFGVAKDCNIVAVKAINDDGKGTKEALVKSISWIINQQKENNHKAIVNLSLKGTYSNIVNKMIDQLSSMGVLVVAAEGYDNGGECKYSPDYGKSASTVGESDEKDTKVGTQPLADM